jgi:ABC-2 type transport system permease protein
VSWAGYGLILEFRSGYLDKLRALPIQRWSILLAETVPLFFQAAGMAGVVLILSVLLGARIETGVAGFAFILLLSGLFGLSFAGLSFMPALLTRSEQATSTLSLILFPLVFMSTAFVPETMMPGWMQVVNDWNPMTFMIEAIRPLMSSGWDWGAIGRALLAMALIGAVLQAGTIWAFRRLTN